MNSYFSHDSNARNDDKILALRMKMGWAGYGLFWAIVEKLREGRDYMCVKDYNVIAFDLRCDAAQIKQVVEDFGLFAFTDDGKCFYSESLCQRMLPVDEEKRKRAEAGRKGGLRKHENAKRKQKPSNARAMLEQCSSYKIKGNEIKGNNTPLPPKGEEEPLIYFEDEKLNTRFKEFLEYRKKIKKNINTPIAVQLLIGKLSKKSTSEALAMLETSIMNGWQGIFEEKSNRVQNQTQQPKRSSQVYHEDRDAFDPEAWNL